MNSGAPLAREPAPEPVSMVSTTELSRRPSRAPDYAAENRALVALAQCMATSPGDVLQMLADTALSLCRAHSAGLSLLEDGDQRRNFHWRAIAGQWASHLGGGTPRDFGPCGTVLDRNTALMCSHPERDFPYFGEVTPLLEEALLIPFYVDGEAVGTIWVVAHDESRRFDAEDLRVMNSLGTFAGAAYQTLLSLNATKEANQILHAQAKRFEKLNRIAKAISSDLDLERTVQTVTDTATELSGAKFGAFFYNVLDDRGESYLLYALSGAPREAFDKFGLPRNTAIFDPTFRGMGIVRSADIRTDPRYGKSAPHYGMPKGHLPVVSYLAAPVVSRSGEVHGGLFFAHDEAGVFTEEAEEVVAGIAAHAAVAIDNARLYQASQSQVELRRRAEEHKELLLNEMKHRVKNSLVTVQAIASQSLKSASPDDRASFLSRLHALSGAHDLLAGQNWDRARIADVVQQAVAPFQEKRSERFVIEGPDAVAVDANKALLLTMALHELATNAVKYGALSNGRGRVRIFWELLKDDKLKLRWEERGGPTVIPPEQKGFGSRLIEGALKRELGGARFDFAPQGVTCTLKMTV